MRAVGAGGLGHLPAPRSVALRVVEPDDRRVVVLDVAAALVPTAAGGVTPGNVGALQAVCTARAPKTIFVICTRRSCRSHCPWACTIGPPRLAPTFREEISGTNGPMLGPEKRRESTMTSQLHDCVEVACVHFRRSCRPAALSLSLRIRDMMLLAVVPHLLSYGLLHAPK